MKSSILNNIKSIAIGSAGGYVGGMVTTAIEGFGLKLGVYSPLVTLGVGAVVKSMVKNPLIQDFAEGMAIAAGTEMLQSLTSGGNINGMNQMGFVPQFMPENMDITAKGGTGMIR
jgi:hypothetical protein